ncbi:hypothetical protein EVAR_93321_1 [Eumeta japonica]|uniref:Uncharacterized protein n=1 Tax=Eumeta variegata TaxID=151549 RepID=A0A4C1UUN9_EUMVA|nr:hypothetical protein EVAR_93321_1 [Eumeta japonica]
MRSFAWQPMRPGPTILSVVHEKYLSIHLTFLQRRLNPLPPRRVAPVPSDFLCRDDSFKASFADIVTRRRHPSVVRPPSVKLSKHSS